MLCVLSALSAAEPEEGRELVPMLAPTGLELGQVTRLAKEVMPLLPSQGCSSSPVACYQGSLTARPKGETTSTIAAN